MQLVTFHLVYLCNWLHLICNFTFHLCNWLHLICNPLHLAMQFLTFSYAIGPFSFLKTAFIII
jgi:hypothetical protein